MDNHKLKKFAAYIKENIPVNTVGGGNIAGLSPDLPPAKLPSQKRKIVKSKRRKP